MADDDILDEPPKGFTFERQRQSVIQRVKARARAATVQINYDDSDEDLSDSSDELDEYDESNQNNKSQLSPVSFSSNSVPTGSIKLQSRISVLARSKKSNGQCQVYSKSITCETAEEALKCMQRHREKKELVSGKPQERGVNKRSRRRTTGMVKYKSTGNFGLGLSKKKPKSLSRLRQTLNSTSSRSLPDDVRFESEESIIRSYLPDHRIDGETPPVIDIKTLRVHRDSPGYSASVPDFYSPDIEAEMLTNSQSLREGLGLEATSPSISVVSPDDSDAEVGGGNMNWAFVADNQIAGSVIPEELPKIDSTRDSSTLKVELNLAAINAQTNSAINLLQVPSDDEDDLEDLNLPFDPPIQPRLCPRNPVGETVYYQYETGEEEEDEEGIWYEMKIIFYESRRDQADARATELFEGEEWGDEFKLKRKYDEGKLYFMNAELAVEEGKAEHIETVFKLIDEKANGDLVFSDFVSGLQVYKQADTPLDLDDEQLKEIFCAIQEECDFEDLEEDEDEFAIETADFLRFCLQETDDATFAEFLNVMWQETLPKRKMVLCKSTDQLYPESQIIYCEDCKNACWIQAARTNDQYPDKFYSPKEYERHLCQNVLPGEKHAHGKFEIEPHYLEEGTDYEEIFCHQCFSRKFAHDVKFSFQDFPLPFELRMSSQRPYITHPSRALELEDIVEGSLIKEIDGKRVGHRLPKDIKVILSMIAPPIEIVFKSFVPKFNKLQRLKTFNQLAQISGWDYDQMDEVQGKAVAVKAEDDDDDEFSDEDVHEFYAKPRLFKMPSELNVIGRWKTLGDNDIRENDDDIFEHQTIRDQQQSVSDFTHFDIDDDEIAFSPVKTKQRLRETPRGQKANSLHFDKPPVAGTSGGAASVATSMNTKRIPEDRWPEDSSTPRMEKRKTVTFSPKMAQVKSYTFADVVETPHVANAIHMAVHDKPMRTDEPQIMDPKLVPFSVEKEEKKDEFDGNELIQGSTLKKCFCGCTIA